MTLVLLAGLTYTLVALGICAWLWRAPDFDPNDAEDVAIVLYFSLVWPMLVGLFLIVAFVRPLHRWLTLPRRAADALQGRNPR